MFSMEVFLVHTKCTKKKSLQNCSNVNMRLVPVHIRGFVSGQDFPEKTVFQVELQKSVGLCIERSPSCGFMGNPVKTGAE